VVNYPHPTHRCDELLFLRTTYGTDGYGRNVSYVLSADYFAPAFSNSRLVQVSGVISFGVAPPSTRISRKRRSALTAEAGLGAAQTSSPFGTTGG